MKFGTDGFRGPADSVITPDFCLRLGFHTGAVIKEKGYDSVIIGKDTRVSGYMLCLLYTSPSPRDRTRSRMPSSA